tara:strand:- start:458 stop:997 length:540 start_codon:yes stop_codon:yes gene_type:complete
MKNLSRKPRPSTVFTNLKNKTIAQLSSDDYNQLVRDAYIEESNLEMLSDLAAVVKFQEKPRGLQLTQVTQSGSVNSSTHVDLLVVPAATTYDIQAVTMIATSGSGTATVDYTVDGIVLGLDFLLKTETFTAGNRGVTVDFSTMGDFLISGLADSAVTLAASRHAGTLTVIHNVWWRQVN